jgi:hypothetical protein
LIKKALPGWQRFFFACGFFQSPLNIVGATVLTLPLDRFKQQTESQSGVFPGPLWH